MKNLTFLIPCRIESRDRLKNIVTSVSYLTYNFPESKIIVYESDKESVFTEKAIPYFLKIFGKNLDNLTHIFKYDDNPFFHKTKILNDLVMTSETEVVYNYDIDHLLPVSSYLKAYDMIVNGNYDAVYCYGVGVYQYLVDYPEEMFEKFIESKFDLNILSPGCNICASVMGLGQMIKRQSEIDSYMWNENFMSWGPEDCEFLYRIQVLGNNVGRVNDICYHLNHERTFNSHYHNPKWQENTNLWNVIRTWDKERMINYYEQQTYVKERRKQLNASI